jgi:hypothetical protein
MSIWPRQVYYFVPETYDVVVSRFDAMFFADRAAAFTRRDRTRRGFVDRLQRDLSRGHWTPKAAPPGSTSQQPNGYRG